jgi:hypothetical protein
MVLFSIVRQKTELLIVIIDGVGQNHRGSGRIHQGAISSINIGLLLPREKMISND